MNDFFPSDHVRRAAGGLAGVLFAVGEWLQPLDQANTPADTALVPADPPARPSVAAWVAWIEAASLANEALAQWRAAGPLRGSNAYAVYVAALDREDAAARELAAVIRYGSAVTRPPSTCTVDPLTYEAADDSRKAATRPNSPGSP